MTLNLLFITVTIQKRNKSIKESLQEARINEILEQNKMKHSDLFFRNI
ncbi:YrzI family small protein [Heyndrickxia sp. NPDC080065]